MDFFAVLAGIVVSSIFLLPLLLVVGSAAVTALPIILLLLWGIAAYCLSNMK